MSRLTKRRMADVAFACGAVVIAVVLAWVLYEVQTLQAQLEASNSALKDEQAAAQQRGEEPVAPPVEELMEDPDQYQGPKGDPGVGISWIGCVDGQLTIVQTDGVRVVPGPCAGPAGRDGADGKDGEDGVDGLPGAPGSPGVDGQDGEDGRGVESWECRDGWWVIHYDDGTEQMTNGVCTVGPVPTG